MRGAIVDATSTASILLQPGDSLAFQVMSWNFGFNAARFGLDPYSTDVSFTFVTAPIGAEASISAWLESPNSLCTARVRRPSGFHPRPFLQLAISRNRLRGCRATCISRASFPKKFSPVVPRCLCCLTTAPMYCPDCLPTRWTGPFGESDGRPAQRGWTLRRRQLPECSRARDSTGGLFALIVLGLARRLKESTVCKHPIHSDTI